MTGTTQIIISMVCYMAVVIVIGIVFAKRANKSSENYFLGGRSLGPWVTAMSAEASDMSGWLLMGLPGVAYWCGLADAFWTALGLAVGTYFNWLIVSKRLRRYSIVANNSITLPEFFSNRFRENKKIICSLAAIFILIFFTVYASSCFVTVGKLFSSLFGADYVPMMILGAVFVFIYTIIGGFLAESASDFMQGIVMFFALTVVVVIGVVTAGGFSEIVENAKEIPGFFEFFGLGNPATEEVVLPKEDGFSFVGAIFELFSWGDPETVLVSLKEANPDGSFAISVLEFLGVGKENVADTQVVINSVPQFGEAKPYGALSVASMMAWGLGYFGMPQVLLRFMAIRKEKELKMSRRIAMIWVVISLAVAVFIGILGRDLYPTAHLTKSAAESIFITLSTNFLPPILAGLVMAGILAATISSSDSYLLISASAFAKNIYKDIAKKDATDKQVMRMTRATLIIITAIAVFLALDKNSVIFNIVSFAWAGFGATFGPLMLFSLFWKRTTRAGAVSGMIGGAAMVFIWKLGISKLGGAFGIYELLPAFIFSSIIIVVVSLLTKKPSAEIEADFDRVKNGTAEEFDEMNKVIEV